MMDKIQVFDFFSGCGGTSLGFQQAGMDIRFALDIDEDSINTFRYNFPAAYTVCMDIRESQPSIIEHLVASIGKRPSLFCGCAPCQPFTHQATRKKRNDERIPLLLEFLRFITHYLPDYVFVENVPGLKKIDSKTGPLKVFLKGLQDLGYADPAMADINAREYGVPQNRKRFVILASRIASIDFPVRTYGPHLRNYATVRDAIDRFPPLEAGQKCSDLVTFPNHEAATLYPQNLCRIRHTPPGGGHNDWPETLQLKCHAGHKGHSDVYGRLAWDKPSVCLTTKCISYSNGRFGHPEQDRALSVREAAALQTFPDSFVFQGSLQSTARQVGNAVPVLMAQCFAKHIIQHWRKNLPAKITA